MMIERADALQLDADPRRALSFKQLADLSGLAEAVLRDLIEYGAVEPIDISAPAWTFTANVVVVARTACRLQRDFELEPDALAVVLRLMGRIDALETEVRSLRARRTR